ncbi:hypothetical protein NFI96_005722 [Prochilodus magdalenae]|nr:hypothetical protein NFI96_005722 [Prochilodus magdalenae]
MGGEWSGEEKEQFAAELFQAVQESSALPDIGIDYSILKYSGLDSASALNSYSYQLVNDLPSRSLGYVKDLGVTLAAFSFIPNGVGLGALVISMLLDVAMNAIKKTEGEGVMLGMIRRVFAEEKASSVRDSMDEYIKRFRLKMHNVEELLSETKRMEEQLSNGLTRLRNSMLHDNQMSSRSMKHWTNGAAFHVQMLIHKARMEVTQSRGSSSELDRQVLSVGQLAEQYRDDLKNLLTKYEAYKRSTISTDLTGQHCGGLYGTVCIYINCGLLDTELSRLVGLKNYMSGPLCSSMTSVYQDYMFKNWNQPKELREYFPTIKQNLRVMIMQNTAFSIQKFLPTSRKKK